MSEFMHQTFCKGRPTCHQRLRMRNARCLLAATALASVTAGVGAQTAESIFSVSGFGTLGGTYHERTGVDFLRDISLPKGARANHLNLEQDSMLGVQLTAKPSEQWQGTVQVVSRNAIGSGYQPEVSWAYIKYKPVENISLRIGRLGIEMYLAGDSSEIGYANLLVRQPVIFYPRAHDGMDVEAAFPAGEGILRLKSMVGNTLGKMESNGTPYEINGALWGALAEYSWHGWTGRLSTGRLKLKNEIVNPNAIAAQAAIALTPNGAAINDTLHLKNRPLHYTSLALAYDKGPLQSQVNLSRLSSPGWSDQNTFFGHIGYRFGQFTPYLAYSRTHTDRDILSTGIPQGLSPATDALNQLSSLAQGGTSKINESDAAIGVRYDFARNTALKVQVDRIRYRDPWRIVDPSLNTSSFESRKTKQLSLLSVALEFVF